MTHRKDATSDVLGRWRTLAEQRLEHLTELFESGRWRRYFGELDFLENIREAKIAVETWRSLATARTIAAEPVIRVSWPESERHQRDRPAELPRRIAPPAPAAIKPESVLAEAVAAEPVVDLLALEQALGTAEQVLDLSAIEQRYPLLRNTL